MNIRKTAPLKRRASISGRLYIYIYTRKLERSFYDIFLKHEGGFMSNVQTFKRSKSSSKLYWFWLQLSFFSLFVDIDPAGPPLNLCVMWLFYLFIIISSILMCMILDIRKTNFYNWEAMKPCYYLQNSLVKSTTPRIWRICLQSLRIVFHRP